MCDYAREVLHLEIPLYGLPEGTDLKSLTPKVLDMVEGLEEMGVFDQREFEPAHVFVIPGGNDV
jgi:hypothetical protein